MESCSKYKLMENDFGEIDKTLSSLKSFLNLDNSVLHVNYKKPQNFDLQSGVPPAGGRGCLGSNYVSNVVNRSL